jgi:hypothetical protein
VNDRSDSLLQQITRVAFGIRTSLTEVGKLRYLDVAVIPDATSPHADLAAIETYEDDWSLTYELREVDATRAEVTLLVTHGDRMRFKRLFNLLDALEVGEVQTAVRFFAHEIAR